MWTDRTRLHECIDQILKKMAAARPVIECCAANFALRYITHTFLASVPQYITSTLDESVGRSHPEALEDLQSSVMVDHDPRSEAPHKANKVQPGATSSHRLVTSHSVSR